MRNSLGACITFSCCVSDFLSSAILFLAGIIFLIMRNINSLSLFSWLQNFPVMLLTVLYFRFVLCFPRLDSGSVFLADTTAVPVVSSSLPPAGRTPCACQLLSPGLSEVSSFLQGTCRRCQGILSPWAHPLLHHVLQQPAEPPANLLHLLVLQKCSEVPSTQPPSSRLPTRGW